MKTGICECAKDVEKNKQAELCDQIDGNKQFSVSLFATGAARRDSAWLGLAWLRRTMKNTKKTCFYAQSMVFFPPPLALPCPSQFIRRLSNYIRLDMSLYTMKMLCLTIHFKCFVLKLHYRNCRMHILLCAVIISCHYGSENQLKLQTNTFVRSKS